jgi:hypothetical protein
VETGASDDKVLLYLAQICCSFFFETISFYLQNVISRLFKMKLNAENEEKQKNFILSQIPTAVAIVKTQDEKPVISYYNEALLQLAAISTLKHVTWHVSGER